MSGPVLHYFPVRVCWKAWLIGAVIDSADRSGAFLLEAWASCIPLWASQARLWVLLSCQPPTDGAAGLCALRWPPAAAAAAAPQGRGEPIRLALAAAGVEYQEQGVDYMSMKKDLENFPFGQAPR